MDKFNYNDFDIEVEIEIGRDEFIYGSYVDWDNFRNQEEENLLESFGVNLPWGRILTFLEYVSFINQTVFTETSIISDYRLYQLEILNHGNNTSEISIQFPKRSDCNSSEIISEIFDFYEVPSNVQYESQLPEDMQYWNSISENDYQDNEYEIFKKYPIDFKDYEQKIRNIQSEINTTSNTLITKALMLTSFIYSESLIKSVIATEIPNENGLSEFSQKILSTEIDKQLRGNIEGRNKLFKELFKVKAPKQNWNNLRNALAHDIETVKVEENKIIYSTKQDEKKSDEINDLFQQQLSFSKELETIFYNNSQ